MLKTPALAAALAIVILAPAAAHAAPIGPVAELHITVSPEVRDDTKVVGDNDITMLTKALHDSVERSLKRSNRLSDKGGVLEVELVKAKPTRPTMTQMSHRLGLSLNSYYRGGMAVTGRYVAPDGAVTPVKYEWESFDIRDAQASWTWGDAERGFDRFAASLVKG